MRLLVSALALLPLVGCDDAPGAVALDAGWLDARVEDARVADLSPPDVAPDATGDAVEDAGPAPIVAVTFNTGTPGRATDESIGYGSEQARYNDEFYGNGLAWPALVDGVAALLAEIDPDVVAFQEVFWPGECPEIPEEARQGFVCEAWRDGDPTVMERVLGPDYRVACHPGNPDKCLGVHRRFGRLGELEGSRVEGCGGGARVARGVVERPDGSTLTVVSFHGSSGLAADDIACRVAQVEQVFVDLGDGRPGVAGALNLVLGDFNTDPGRLLGIDASAQRWIDFTGERFAFVTEVGADATPTYGLAANIDHLVSDGLAGPCWAASVTGGRPELPHAEFFDHRPVVCALWPRAF